MLIPQWLMILVILTVILLIVFYKYVSWNFDYWKQRGVDFEKPSPILGSVKEVLFFKTAIGNWMKNLYVAAGNSPCYGIFIFDEPKLIIKSPELIKRILIRDFQYFEDRSMAVPEHNELEKTWLFLVKNPTWKEERTNMSPLFSSFRLKNMFKILENISCDMNVFIDNHLGELECKDLCSKFSMEAIAQCMFGIKPYSFKYENPEFWNIGKSLFEYDLRNSIIHALFFFRQKWAKFLKLNLQRASTERYLLNAFLESLSAREGKVGPVNDMVDIVKQLKENNKFGDYYDGPKVGSQALMFFQAGYETTSSTIAFALYELALHPNIQHKLRQEIISNIKAHGGITWEGINGMKFLDMCLAETMRKYPALPFLDRESNCDYKIPESGLVIEKGMTVYIPILGMHNDEQYFSNPSKFDPDRFADGLNSYGAAYIPFGIGPRNCIGERFGRIASKIALSQMLSRFEFSANERTPVPMVFSKKGVTLQSDVGIPLTVKEYVPT